MSKINDLTGQTFGRLTVIGIGTPYVGSDGRKRTRWECVCSCGSGRHITTSASNLRNGRTASCGCLSLEIRTKHGLRKHPLYYIWTGMKNRCYNTNDKGYPNYGERGIRVCDRWKDSFENFYKDVIEGYEKGLQIDRKDNDGDYEPDNVRWVTRSQNQSNRRSHKNSSSKYKGVSWHKRDEVWRVMIMKEGVSTYLGSFKNEIDAAKAYNVIAIEIFGEFANLNVVEETRKVVGGVCPSFWGSQCCLSSG